MTALNQGVFFQVWSTFNSILLLSTLIFIVFSCYGCSKETDKKPIADTAEGPESKSKTLTLASFAPSNTELIYSLNAEDSLVGVSTECKFPEKAKSKPKVGSFIAAKYEKLAKIKPDVALLVSGQESLASQLDRHHYRTEVLNNYKLSDIPTNLKFIGKISGKTKEASYLSEQFNRAISELKEILEVKEKPSLLFCIWLNPSICVGGEGFLNDVITICSATNAVDELSSSYPKLTPEKIISSNPDILILPFEAKADNQISRPPWSSLKAVKSKRVIFLPEAKSDMLSRPTLRILSGLHWLAVRLHPEESERLTKWLATHKPILNKR